MCVHLAVEGEEEDEGDPICLFCPPDVSESRLRDLAWGGAARGLKLLNHLRPWLMSTNTQRRNQEVFLLLGIKKMAVSKGWRD